MPHAFTVGVVVQTLPEQQPFGQLVELQTQDPAEQAWPAGQAGPDPQRHWPPEHVSAVDPQARQAPPFDPQALTDGVLQVLPEQQPVGQLVGLQAQAPFVHIRPGAQAGPAPHVQEPFVQPLAVEPHACPQAPQFVTSFAVSMQLPLQLVWPGGQQTVVEHLPPLQDWPLAHAWPQVPQL